MATQDMTVDVASRSATELRAAYAAHDISPVEATVACLERIAECENQVNAFCVYDGERALAAASESEARWQAGSPRGLLDGIPVAVKDVFRTSAWPTLRGMPFATPGAYTNADAPAVAALTRHGAVLIGKTRTPQFAWKGVTDGPGIPTTTNPWDPTRTPGGSSGGSAAALALGLVTLAVGTDGAGSVRIPASMCGVVGFKPTFGRVPTWPANPFGLLSHAGPMGRTVRDLALLLDVLAEPDPRDWAALPPPPVSYSGLLNVSLRGRRVAFSPNLGVDVPVDGEVAAATETAAAVFEHLGAHVEQVDLRLNDARPTLTVLWQAACAAGIAALEPELVPSLEPGLREWGRRGARLSARDLLAADAQRARIGERMGQFHEKWDLLITPTLPIVAFRAGQLVPDGWEDPDWLSWTPFTYPFNLTQQPAASIPSAVTDAGLPIGVQIVGGRHHDALVLAAAHGYETAGGREQPIDHLAVSRPQVASLERRTSR